MRRDAIDVARISALVIVVLGHLSLAVIDRVDGAVRGANLLELHPAWAVLAALAPMPVFFAAAGWAHVTSSLATASSRLSSLVGLGAVVVTVWSVGVLVIVAVIGDAGVFGDGARIATQPLWFVAGYAALVPLGSQLARLAREHLGLALTVALGGLAVLDVSRFVFDAPEWIGWIGFYLVWATPWLLGAWWRAAHEAGGFDEGTVGLLLIAGAVVGGFALVRYGGYAPALIDAVPGKRSNTTPPGLYTCVAAIGQVGVLMVLGRWLDRLGQRYRKLWDRAGEVSLGIYVWHLSALALCGALIAAGLYAPERLTTVWWLTRPVWWVVVLGVATSFVLLTSLVRSQLKRRSKANASPPEWQAALGVFLAVAGGALVGLRGPRTAPLALECVALFVTSWLLLRQRTDHRLLGK